MRFKQIVENSTTAGSVATVAKPMMTQTRENTNVRGLKPVQQVMKGAKKKGPYANSIVESKVTEDDLAEQDLIVIPGQGRLRRTGFVKHDMDQGEHEGHTLKNSLHTIARAASELDKRLSVQSEFPEWVSEKIGAAKGMMVSVMDYLISSQEMQHDPDAINELSSDLLQRSAQLAKNKSNQAMKPEVHNALGGGYMNPLAKHYDDVSQKISNKAVQAGKKEAIRKIASPAVMRKMGITEGEVSTSNLRTMYDLARMAKNYCDAEGQESLNELLKILKWYMDQAEQGVAEAKGKLTYTPEPTEYGVFPDSKNEFVKTFLSRDLALAHIKKFGGKLIVLDQHGRRMKEGVAEGQLDELSRDTLNAYLRKSKNRADDFHAQGEKASMEPGRKAMAKGDKYFDKRDNVLSARRGARDRLKGVFHPKEAPYGAKKADDSDAMQEALNLDDLRKAAASSRSPEDKAALKRNPNFSKLMQKSVDKHNKAVVKTKKDIGSRVADIGPGGKEYNVKTDAAWDAAKKSVEEGWKSKIGAAALAGAAALGGGAAHAHELPSIVAQITFQVDGKTVTKDINLGTEYQTPGHASQAIKDFMKSKGIKFYNFELHRADAQPPLVSKDEMDASNQEYERQHNSNNLSTTPYSAKGDQSARLQTDKGYTSSSRPGASIAYEGAKVDRMVKHVKQSEKKLGHSNKEAENIAWATANKRDMLDNKNKKA